MSHVIIKESSQKFELAIKLWGDTNLLWRPLIKCHCRTTPALVVNVCVNQYHYPIKLACDLGSMKAKLQLVTSN